MRINVIIKTWIKCKLQAQLSFHGISHSFIIQSPDTHLLGTNSIMEPILTSQSRCWGYRDEPDTEVSCTLRTANKQIIKPDSFEY